MKSRFFSWQMLVSSGLGLILLFEWGYSDYSRNQLQSIMDRKIQADYQADELPQLSLSKQSAESFINIVERPLFIEGRKPLPEIVETSSEASANDQLDDWSLIGIYTKNKRQVALFRKQNEARKFLKLNEDQTISGWQLKQIQADRVVLQQGGQEKSVMLRKPRLPSKVPPPPKRPAVPRQPAAPVAPINNPSSKNENNDS
jgi:type II secretory pathway component PulC